MKSALEYDFVVSPGADPTVIRLAFDGVDRLDVDDQGDLVLHVRSGEVRQHKPLVYQEIDGVRREISGSYLIRDHQQVTFLVSDYDASRPLTIDPVLVYSMSLNSNALNAGLDIAVDAAGSAHVTGRVCCGDDAFVAKVNPAGTDFDYFTILSGGSNPFGGAPSRIALDPPLGTNAVDVYVTGTTGGNFVTTPGAYQPAFGGGSLDAFVAKLDGMTGTVLDATYLGGIGDDVGRGIALNPFHYPDCYPWQLPAPCPVFVTGATTSTNFPTANLPNAQPWQQNHNGSQDAFVTVLNPAGGAGDDLIYSIYLGGSGHDIAHSIAADPYGFVHVTGETTSIDFPNYEGVPQGSGGTDAFVTVLSPSENSVVFSIPLLWWLSSGSAGSSDEVVGTGVATDFSGNTYVTSWTTFGFDGFAAGGIDAFVAKLNTAGGGGGLPQDVRRPE